MPIPLGILAVAGASAAAATFEHIESVILTGAQTNITFSNVPQTYKHLQVRAVIRGTAASDFVEFRLRFNSDTGANYANHVLRGQGSNPISQETSRGDTKILLSGTGNSAAANIYATNIIDILDYTSTAKNTTIMAMTGNNSGIIRYDLASGLWVNTAAVTTVGFSMGSNDFGTGTRISLYGIRG